MGIGIIISALLMTANTSQNIPKYKVEKLARQLGMMYPDEIKAYFDKK